MSNVQGTTGNEAYRNAPWSKRASLLPRGTYSADSKIIYKRRKHVMTLKDANRIMDKLLAEEESREESKGFYLGLLAFIQKLIEKVLKFLIKVSPAWALNPVYQILFTIGDSIGNSPALPPEGRQEYIKVFNNFMGQVERNLRRAWTGR